MSNELMFSEALVRPQPDERAAPAARSADAELVLAALDRMEAMIRGQGAALERLRADLPALAGTLAQAKAALQASAIKPDAGADGKPTGVHALLDELEHRIDALLEAAGVERPVPERASAEPVPAVATAPVPPPVDADAEAAIGDRLLAEIARRAEVSSVDASRVPTVSGVVSRLGRTSEPPTETVDLDDDLPPPAAARPEVPTVAMLEAMVEALTVTPRADDTAAAQAVVDDDVVVTESTLEFVAPEADASGTVAAVDATSGTMSDVAEPQAASFETEDTDLIAVETAIADNSAPAPAAIDAAALDMPGPAPLTAEPDSAQADAPAADGGDAPSAAAEAAPEAARGPLLPDVDLLTSFERMEAFPFLPPEEVGTAVIFGARRVLPMPAPSETVSDARTAESEAGAAAEPGVGDSANAAGESDVAALPQEAAIDTDEAAATFEPAAEQMDAVAATSELSSSAADDDTFEDADAAAEESDDDGPAPTIPAHDPLAPLKAMSEEERIALFS
jgi:hypothetical protein